MADRSYDIQFSNLYPSAFSIFFIVFPLQLYSINAFMHCQLI